MPTLQAQAREPRKAILYTRIKPSNKQWVRTEAKRLKFRSESEWLDTLIDLARQGKRKQDARRKKGIQKRN